LHHQKTRQTTKEKKMKTYKYGMRLRGFSLGCQPMNGLVDRMDDPSGRFWNILVYNRELTEREIKDYELEAINEETHT